MVSDKEIEAAIKAIEAVPIMGDTYSLSGEDAKAVARAALTAAARVRAEANNECGEAAHPAPQPSGTVGVKPLANLIHDALAFAVWAAGEGLCPTDGPPAPEDFLYAYSTATGFEDWDAIPHHVAAILSALTAGKPEQAVPSGKHWFAVQSPTGVHIGLWDDGKIAYGVAAEYGSDYTIMELVELPVAPTAGGGDA